MDACKSQELRLFAREQFLMFFALSAADTSIVPGASITPKKAFATKFFVSTPLKGADR
jgi:hypothetical protein